MGVCGVFLSFYGTVASTARRSSKAPTVFITDGCVSCIKLEVNDPSPAMSLNCTDLEGKQSHVTFALI